jgi:hypothetical protein
MIIIPSATTKKAMTRAKKTGGPAGKRLSMSIRRIA